MLTSARSEPDQNFQTSRSGRCQTWARSGNRLPWDFSTRDGGWDRTSHLDIFTQPKVYDAKTKSLLCQNSLFTICLSLVHDVLDMSKSTSTYCRSHLFISSGNLVAHLIDHSQIIAVPFYQI